MPKLSQTLLAPILHDFAPHAGPCALALIGMWMAKFGGRDPVELLNAIHEISPHLTEKERKDLELSVATHDLASLQLACEVIAAQGYQRRVTALELMCTIAVDDGYLTVSEHEFLLFLAQAFGFQPNELESAFRHASKDCPLPELPLLDEVSWWQKREGRRADHQEHTASDQPPHHDRNTRLHDLGLLGLDEGATDAEIRRAYVRLAQIHHPDKYQVLGEEAMREAEVAFSRIKAAYERLTNA